MSAPAPPPTGTYSVSLRSCPLLFSCLSVALCRPVLSFRCARSLLVVSSLPLPLVYVFYAPPAGSASDRRKLTQAHSWALRRVQTKTTTTTTNDNNDDSNSNNTKSITILCHVSIIHTRVHTTRPAWRPTPSRTTGLDRATIGRGDATVGDPR